jgi:hypothetical protein
MPELARAERLGAKSGHFRGQLSPAQPDKVPPFAR